ncbi:hypothetical protein B0T17DRAFT_501185 [Bombardia bombarda]|uniref:Ysc84 actin-binding domain-containing protein n=1 Tax=Bombardia bombarda TaxID=252184 RepID=A0AA39WCG4_9PEZI|nr:hypothetical protein B0T17DRAFT_501185 [Bombardia bombarda]
MSANNTDKTAAIPPTQQQQQPYFPPPPPGPPPVQSQAPAQQAPQHSNETPIPDYNIPTYHPTQFAPPPTAGDDDIYNSTPTDEHPPHFPPTSEHKPHEAEHASKSGWSSKLAGWGSKAAVPFNTLVNKMGSETFLPTTLDKECEKAARILRSFCKDGIYSDATPQTQPSQTTIPAAVTEPSSLAANTQPPTAEKPTSSSTPPTAATKKPRVLLTIPSKVIAKAQGLAIFTTVRAGFQVSGASGSGILIARLPDGSWSPPSGIQVHSVGAGFVIGLDIYDCVVVINSKEALEAFTRTRMSLGSDLAVTAGPWGAGGALDWGVPQSQKGKEKAAAAEGQAPPTGAPVAAQQQPPLTTGSLDPAPAGSAAAQGAAIQRKPSPFRDTLKRPVYSYVKSRGFYAGVQIDGTVVTERKDANAAFYGHPASVDKILKGEVPAHGPVGMWPAGAKGLFEVLRGAEGWRGQGQAGAPVPAHAQGGAVPPAHAYAPSAGVQAPATPAPAPAASVPSAGVAGVTAGVKGLNVGSGAGSSSSAAPASALGTTGGPMPPPPAAALSAADRKAAEAAAERASVENAFSQAPPPLYTEHHDTEHHGGQQQHDDLPPAYVEDGQDRLGDRDSKTGRH